jgi:heparan-alpha-glucosaminide N-acetyltransferase
MLRPLPLSAESRSAVARARWLDAFRGFTMLCLVSRGFGFPRLAKFDRAEPIAEQFEHVAWVGLTAWDLVQPFFMFIVGAAMPFAFAVRRGKGGTWLGGWPHVLWRAAILVLLSHVAMIGTGASWDWQLINVLAQIAFAYVLAYIVLDVRWTWQLAFCAALLAIHGAMHIFWSGVGAGGPWAKDANVGAAIDQAVLGKTWSGGYATINFITSATATIAGIMAANVLRSTTLSTAKKFGVIALSAAILIGVGFGMSYWIPIVKRIWTPSFAMVSVGITLVALLVFYAIDIALPRLPAGILTAIGANCIFIYMANILLGGRIRDIIIRLLGPLPEWAATKYDFPKEPWTNFAADWLVLGVIVYVAVWLYRRKVFIKI